MADNYLESKYEEYVAQKEAQKKNLNKGKISPNIRRSAINDLHRSKMREEYGD